MKQKLFQEAKESGKKVYDDDWDDELIMVDLLRRSGQFEEALKICDAALKEEPDETVHAILIFQKELISMSDISSHTVAEAVRPKGYHDTVTGNTDDYLEE